MASLVILKTTITTARFNELKLYPKIRGQMTDYRGQNSLRLRRLFSLLNLSP